MRVLIIEDEKLSAEHLANMLQRVDPSIEIMGMLDTVKKGVEALKKDELPELLFLDIHLADGISFEIFKEVKIDIPVIFTTAYNDYAIKAFELNSVDYLLKPISKADLEAALEKYRRWHEKDTANGSNEANSGLLERLLPILESKKQAYKTRFLVKLGEQIASVKTEEVAHFIAEDGIVLLVNLQGKRFPLDYTIDQLEQLLDPQLFFRINRKILIHQDAIEKITTFFNSRLKIHAANLSEEAAVVSRERVGEFKAWLDR